MRPRPLIDSFPELLLFICLFVFLNDILRVPPGGLGEENPAQNSSERLFVPLAVIRPLAVQLSVLLIIRFISGFTLSVENSTNTQSV